MKLKVISILTASLLLGACSDGDAVGTVGGETISKAQFEAYMKFKRIPLDNEAKYQRVLNNYLKREALATAIADTDAVDTLLLEQEVKAFKRQRLINRYFETYLREAVTDEGVSNFYQQNIEKYQSKKIHVAHILFRVKPNMSETERQAILTTAHEAYSRIQAGEAFSDVALAVSQDTVSAKKGGDLGWIVEGAVAPEFSQKIFSMAEGKTSEPFLTTFGFHIAKVLDAQQLVKKPLEAVKGDIRYQLKNESKAAERQRLLDSIDFKVEA